MDDAVHLTRTKYEGDNGQVTWGWRIHSEPLDGFMDCYQTPEEVPTHPIKLLEKALSQATNRELELFLELLEDEQGMYINGAWHEFRVIAPVVQKALEEEEFL